MWESGSKPEEIEIYKQIDPNFKEQRKHFSIRNHQVQFVVNVPKDIRNSTMSQISLDWKLSIEHRLFVSVER